MKVLFVLMVPAGVALLLAQPNAQSRADRPPVIRAIEFKNFRGISVKEAVRRLNDRDVCLVERPYDTRNVEAAQQILEELLEEKGRRGTHVRTSVSEMPPHSVRVTFTALKE